MNILEKITKIKNSRSNECKTTKIFVKGMEDNCIDVINEVLSEFDYTVIKQYSLSKTYLLNFDSIEEADRAIDALNGNTAIKYATPDYKIRAN